MLRRLNMLLQQTTMRHQEQPQHHMFHQAQPRRLTSHLEELPHLMCPLVQCRINSLLVDRMRHQLRTTTQLLVISHRNPRHTDSQIIQPSHHLKQPFHLRHEPAHLRRLCHLPQQHVTSKTGMTCPKTSLSSVNPLPEGTLQAQVLLLLPSRMLSPLFHLAHHNTALTSQHHHCLLHQRLENFRRHSNLLR